MVQQTDERVALVTYRNLIMAQHTGGQEELRDAMNDVANTVEYILDNELKEG